MGDQVEIGFEGVGNVAFDKCIRHWVPITVDTGISLAREHAEMMTFRGDDDRNLGGFETYAAFVERFAEVCDFLPEDVLVLTLGNSVAHVEGVC